MDKLKYIKLENEDGSYSDSIPLAVDSDHVDVGGNTLTNALSYKANNSSINNLQNQISSLASGSPLVASSTSEMTDTTRIYVNTTDGKWYYYNSSSWIAGGTYQSTGIANDSIYKLRLNKKTFGNLFKFDGIRNYGLLVFEIAQASITNVTSIKVKGKVYVKRANIAGTNTKLLLRRVQGYNPSTGASYAQYDLPYNDIYEGGPLYMEDAKKGYIPFECEATGLSNAAVNAIDFRWNYNNSENPLDAEYYVKDIEIWINGNYIDNVYMSTNLETYYGSDVTPEKDFTVRKNDFENLENKVEEIDITINGLLDNYEAATKSSLYNITCWGDSITEGGSPGSPYPTYLQNLLGENIVVNNKGVSGECSGIIAFRQGGNVIETNESFIIPTSGASAAFTMNFSSGYAQNFSNDNGKIKVSILDIEGKLDITARDASTATITGTFTRDIDGIEVSVPSGTKVVSLQNLYADSMSIIWVGRNDIAFAWPHQIDGVLENVKSMINHLSTDIKRFLVVSCTTTTQEEEGGQTHGWVTSYNEQLKALYPYNFVDMENYLVNQCIYDAGITPTAEDLEKMEAKTIPPSLMAPDGIHPNDTAKQYIAQYIYNEMQKRDWLR